jgi:hypothetical protein
MSHGATESWIMSRIGEALDQADVARATARASPDEEALSTTARRAALGRRPRVRSPTQSGSARPAPAAASGQYRNPAP